MPTTSRPGIRTKPSMKRRPQRDALGRFAPNAPKLSTLAQDFEQMLQESPHWLKRFRRWLGKKLFRAAIVIYGF